MRADRFVDARLDFRLDIRLDFRLDIARSSKLRRDLRNADSPVHPYCRGQIRRMGNRGKSLFF